MQPFISDTVSLIKEESRIFIGQYEIAASIFRYQRPEITIAPDTEIVIEGAPSSGNSFATIAFDEAQERKIRVAHHHHLPFQVSLACRRDLPCLLLIRQPLDAVVSRVVRYGYYAPRTLQAVLWVNYSLRHWIMFYVRVLPYLSKVAVCDFSQLIHDYYSVIEQVNLKFKTAFNPPSQEVCARSLSALAEGVKPDKEREIRKSEFKKWARQEPRFGKSLERAEKLYATITGRESPG